jgi:hypothetical protein
MDKVFERLINSDDEFGKVIFDLLRSKETLLSCRDFFKKNAERSLYPGQILKWYSYGLSLSETIGRINGLLGSIKDDLSKSSKGSKRKN